MKEIYNPMKWGEPENLYTWLIRIFGFVEDFVLSYSSCAQGVALTNEIFQILLL